jgi:putative copper resistance protein D
VEGALIAARTLHFAAAVSLTGIFGFRCLVAGPAFRRADVDLADAGGLQRRTMWLSWASLVLLVVSGMAWLVLVSARMSGQTVAGALSQGVLATVLLQTRFGEDWLLRSVLAALLAACLAAAARPRLRDNEAVAWAGLLLAGPMLAALAWAGHGAATAGERGQLHLAADVLHLLAAGVWLGALVPLALLLAEARRSGGVRWRLLARIAVLRFSTMAVVAVGILFASGVVNTWFLAGTLPALVGTGYGRLLLAKVALFVLMLMIAAVNMRRLSPRLAADVRAMPAIGHLRRNALAEGAFGLGVLALVGVLGILPPGLHTEPRWPFPVRIELADLPLAATIALAVLAAGALGCIAAAVAAAAAGYYRRAAIAAAGPAVCLAIAWVPLRPAIEPAYPTSFYAPAEPYAADTVARGASIYAANCALCHGVSGRGDGPAAASLPIRPADLTEPHLFAHQPGDLYWWVSRGKGGVMPGFADTLKPNQRWDVIIFVLARAAGIASRQVGPELAAAASPPVPDFAFEVGGKQKTLRQVLKKGPILLVLYGSPAPLVRLRQLAAAQPRLAAAGLHIIAIGPGAAGESRGTPPLAVGVSREVAATLALFRIPGDDESELMLDRGGNVRLRWSSAASGGLPTPDRLVADAERVARIPVAAASHAGHAH